MPLHVGIDLVWAESVRDALEAAHGDRYLERVYTERERHDCRTPDGIDPERLAARFAAKEATLKVLPAWDTGLAWTAIEVCRAPSGRVHLELRGRAAELAAQDNLVEFSLSLTHDAGLAAAVVVARSDDSSVASTSTGGRADHA